MPAKKAKRSKKSRRPVSYMMGVEDWDWFYSFGIDRTRHAEGPYMELRSLDISGPLLVPTAVKAGRCSVHLMPKRELNAGLRENHQPKSIGFLSLRGDKLEAAVFVPAEALPPLLQVVIAGRLRYVIVDGERLYYRQGDVHHVSFHMQLDEEDFPADEY